MKYTFSSTTKAAIRSKTSATATIVYYVTEANNSYFYLLDAVDKLSPDNDDTVLVSKKGLRFKRYSLAAVTPKPEPVPTPKPTTKVFDISSLVEGHYEKDSLPGFKNAAGVKHGTSFLADVPNLHIIETVEGAIDIEVEVGISCDHVFLRRQADGSAVFFSYKANGNGNFWAGITPYGIDVPTWLNSSALYVDEAVNAKLSGFPKGKFQFGTKGYEYYAKYNGVEFYRARQLEILQPGNVSIHGFEGNNFLDGLKVTYFPENEDSVDMKAKILRPEKIGFKPGKGTATIKKGEAVLNFANEVDASKWGPGDLGYIPIGFEDPFLGRVGITRGKPGVGKVWPGEGFPMLADLIAANPPSIYAWVHADGKTYQKIGEGWFPKDWESEGGYNSDYYIRFAQPGGLRFRVISQNGKQVFIDTKASQNATNADVWHDSEELFNSCFGWGALTPAAKGIKVVWPVADYCFAEWFNINHWTDFEMVGSGYGKTNFISPAGTACVNIFVNFCDNYKQSGISFLGNVAKDGFAGRWWPRNVGGNAVAPMDENNTPYFGGGVTLGHCNNHNVEAEVHDTQTGGIIVSNCIGGTRKLIYKHSTGLFRYNGWSDNTTDGTNDCTSDGSTFESPISFPAFESFGGVNNTWKNISSINGKMSSNTAEAMHIDGFKLVWTKNSRGWNDQSDPSINFNENTGRQDQKDGGSVKNGTIHFEDYVDEQGNFKKGVVVQDGYNNATIENVEITYAVPYKVGSMVGCMGIQSTGKNTTVIRVKCFGGQAPANPLQAANISVLDGYIIECEADTIAIASGTLRDCKAKQIFVTKLVKLEGNNEGEIVNMDWVLNDKNLLL